jgi:hypothetical protein
MRRPALRLTPDVPAAAITAADVASDPVTLPQSTLEELMRTRIPVLLGAVAALVTAAAPAAAATPVAGARPMAAAGWTIVASPTPPPGSDLNAVAVPTARTAWAVGKNHRYGTDHQMVILRWDGAAWTVADAPNSRCYNEALFGVTFTSPSNGWAVGETPRTARQSLACSTAPKRGALIVQDTPVPVSGTDTLKAVSAVSATEAWAVGRSAFGVPLVSHLTAGAWRTVPVPTADLNGVAAVSANDVWAVGFTTISGGGTAPAILHYNGSAWSRVAVPAVPGGMSLTAVTAVTANDVWAVGYAILADGVHPMIVHYDGVSWRAVTVPELPDGGTGRLAGVTARSATDVWAVGARSQNQTLTMHYDGSTWSIVPSPNNDVTDPNNLNAVAADRVSGETWAVGQWSGSVPETLTMRFDARVSS